MRRKLSGFFARELVSLLKPRHIAFSVTRELTAFGGSTLGSLLKYDTQSKDLNHLTVSKISL